MTQCTPSRLSNVVAAPHQLWCEGALLHCCTLAPRQHTQMKSGKLRRQRTVGCHTVLFCWGPFTGAYKQLLWGVSLIISVLFWNVREDYAIRTMENIKNDGYCHLTSTRRMPGLFANTCCSIVYRSFNHCRNTKLIIGLHKQKTQALTHRQNH